MSYIGLINVLRLDAGSSTSGVNFNGRSTTSGLFSGLGDLGLYNVTRYYGMRRALIVIKGLGTLLVRCRRGSFRARYRARKKGILATRLLSGAIVAATTTGDALDASAVNCGLGCYLYVMVGASCGYKVGHMFGTYNVGVFLGYIGIISTLIAGVIYGLEYILYGLKASEAFTIRGSRQIFIGAKGANIARLILVALGV